MRAHSESHRLPRPHVCFDLQNRLTSHDLLPPMWYGDDSGSPSSRPPRVPVLPFIICPEVFSDIQPCCHTHSAIFTSKDVAVSCYFCRCFPRARLGILDSVSFPGSTHQHTVDHQIRNTEIKPICVILFIAHNIAPFSLIPCYSGLYQPPFSKSCEPTSIGSSDKTLT